MAQNASTGQLNRMKEEREKALKVEYRKAKAENNEEKCRQIIKEIAAIRMMSLIGNSFDNGCSKATKYLNGKLAGRFAVMNEKLSVKEIKDLFESIDNKFAEMLSNVVTSKAMAIEKGMAVGLKVKSKEYA